MDRRFFPAAAGRAVSASPSDTHVAGRADAPPRSEALPKEKRLAKRREFLRVYEKGRKIFSRYSVLFFAANDLPYSRIGVTATKKLGKAHLRNKLKRWTREIYRHERFSLDIDSRSLDLVVNVKPNAADATFREYSDDLVRGLRRVAGESRP
jgi:ribonuclease P protein component